LAESLAATPFHSASLIGAVVKKIVACFKVENLQSVVEQLG
jgi:hypothetical protein